MTQAPDDRAKLLADLVRRLMPRVAELVAEKRREWGADHVVRCQVNGLAGRPGWFFAREGPLAIGTPWVGDPVMSDFAAASIAPGQAVLVMCEPAAVGEDGELLAAAAPGQAPAASIGEKVSHVRAAGQSRAHGCHWPGCANQVPPAQWGCRGHWFRLPADLRSRIWKAYRPGQEEDLRPSVEYLEVARAVQEWIRANARIVGG